MLSPAESVAFYLGSVPVKFYSLAMFAAICSGIIVTYFISKRYYKEVNTDRLFDILPLLILFAILGARAYYVLVDWDYFSRHLNEIVAVWNGGISIHGAILGGFLGGLLGVKKYKLDLWLYADVCSYGVVLGQAIGRIGNYFNIEAFGKPCLYSDMLCLYVPSKNRPTALMMHEYFHPTFLYEMVWDVFVFFVLLFVVRKVAKNYKGVVFFAYLLLYSLGRFVIEGVRVDSVLDVAGMPVAQVVSLLLMGLSVCMIFYLKHKKSKAE